MLEEENVLLCLVAMKGIERMKSGEIKGDWREDSNNKCGSAKLL